MNRHTLDKFNDKKFKNFKIKQETKLPLFKK